MGRPAGSPNRERPFNDALRMALRARPLALRRIADKLLDKGEQGDLAAAREVIDRTDGKAVQAIDCGEVLPERLTDDQLYSILARKLSDDPDPSLKALPAPR